VPATVVMVVETSRAGTLALRRMSWIASLSARSTTTMETPVKSLLWAAVRRSPKVRATYVRSSGSER
jgi:hypothetical protein